MYAPIRNWSTPAPPGAGDQLPDVFPIANVKYSGATPLLFVAYALIGVWAVITFRFRKSEHIYVSQWYLLAALFWFPWLYSIAQIMLIFEAARGTVQALVNWWFAHNVLGLWFTPIGLAAAYYFIPKVLGKPIHSYSRFSASGPSPSSTTGRACTT